LTGFGRVRWIGILGNDALIALGEGTVKVPSRESGRGELKAEKLSQKFARGCGRVGEWSWGGRFKREWKSGKRKTRVRYIWGGVSR